MIDTREVCVHAVTRETIELPAGSSIVSLVTAWMRVIALMIFDGRVY
jgi:hypothetical protein